MSENCSDRPSRYRIRPLREIAALIPLILMGLAFCYMAVTWNDPRPLSIPNMIEAEDLPVAATNGIAGASSQSTKEWAVNRWTGNSHLFVMTSAEDASIDFKLPRYEPGQYLVSGYFTRAGDYGVVQVFVDGRKTGPKIDLPTPRGIEPTGEIRLGVVSLQGEEDTLRVALVGHSVADTIVHHNFGIEGFRIDPITVE